jgi:hypothetical protein
MMTPLTIVAWAVAGCEYPLARNHATFRIPVRETPEFVQQLRTLD